MNGLIHWFVMVYQTVWTWGITGVYKMVYRCRTDYILTKNIMFWTRMEWAELPYFQIGFVWRWCKNDPIGRSKLHKTTWLGTAPQLLTAPQLFAVPSLHRFHQISPQFPSFPWYCGWKTNPAPVDGKHPLIFFAFNSWYIDGKHCRLSTICQPFVNSDFTTIQP